MNTPTKTKGLGSMDFVPTLNVYIHLYAGFASLVTLTCTHAMLNGYLPVQSLVFIDTLSFTQVHLWDLSGYAHL